MKIKQCGTYYYANKNSLHEYIYIFAYIIHKQKLFMLTSGTRQKIFEICHENAKPGKYFVKSIERKKYFSVSCYIDS